MTNSVEAASDASLLRAGITRTLDDQVRDHFDADRLRLVLREHTPQRVPVNLLHAGNRYVSPNVWAFVTAARTRLATAKSGIAA